MEERGGCKKKSSSVFYLNATLVYDFRVTVSICFSYLYS